MEDYIKLNSETLEPSETGIYYRKVTSESGCTLYELANGELDIEGNWIPAPQAPPETPPEPPPTDEQLRITQLEQQLMQKDADISNLRDEMANQTTAILEIYDILGGM